MDTYKWKLSSQEPSIFGLPYHPWNSWHKFLFDVDCSINLSSWAVTGKTESGSKSRPSQHGKPRQKKSQKLVPVSLSSTLLYTASARSLRDSRAPGVVTDSRVYSFDLKDIMISRNYTFENLIFFQYNAPVRSPRRTNGRRTFCRNWIK